MASSAGVFYAPFGASGAGHFQGLVPDPGAVGGTTRFLREDSSFAALVSATSRIALVTLAVDSASISFSSIPATYTSLLLQVVARSDQASGPYLLLRFNGDSAANYDWSIMYNNGGTPTGTGATAAAALQTGVLAYNASSAHADAVFTFLIHDYADSANWFKDATWTHTMIDPANLNTYVTAGGGGWRNVAAITTITLVAATGNLKAASYAALYGLQ